MVLTHTNFHAYAAQFLPCSRRLHVRQLWVQLVPPPTRSPLACTSELVQLTVLICVAFVLLFVALF